MMRVIIINKRENTYENLKNLENGSVVEGLLVMDVVPNGYRELKAGEVDAAQEKHVPQVSVEDNKLKVVVGSVEPQY